MKPTFLKNIISNIKNPENKHILELYSEEIEQAIESLEIAHQKELMNAIKERDKLLKYIKRCLKYCELQNGLPFCKNCGLDLEDIK